jgi:type IV pilus secretin PilQ/predicted competence protein
VIRTIPLLALWAALLTALPAAAQPPAREAQVTVTPASGASPDPLVSLDAEDAALPNVLKILAEKGGLNLITGAGVSEGRVTLRLKDVPIEAAVNLVVRAAGLSYERIGNSILVADPAMMKGEIGLSSYLVDLKYADAFEVMEALKNLNAQVSVDPGSNKLIVVTSPRIIAEIQNIVSSLDRPARQVVIEVRVVEVGTDDLKQIGIDWDQLARTSFVVVEGATDSVSSAPGGLPSALPFVGNGSAAEFWKLGTFARQPLYFQFALDLLVRNGNARVLASPKIATLNGREANILVGQRIPYEIGGTVFAGGGAAPVVQVQKEEVGIKLRITPLINDDGYITTQISPEVSSVIGFSGRNNDLPIVSTRQVSTTVRLRDGASVIIGGLLAEERTNTVTKVPVLGDIPLLGALFRHQGTQTRKTDLVIEVTPRLMDEQP